MKLFKKNLLSGDTDLDMDDVIDVKTAEIISELGADNNSLKANHPAPAAKAPPPVTQQPAQKPVQQPAQPPQARQPQSAQPRQRPKPAPMKYGIQEAIELVNQLPTDAPEIIVPVVVKTLESAGIQLTEIIIDAEHHEEIIETQSIEMLEKIEALESQINKLNEEVMILNNELEQTTRVKQLLQSAIPKGK